MAHGLFIPRIFFSGHFPPSPSHLLCRLPCASNWYTTPGCLRYFSNSLAWNARRRSRRSLAAARGSGLSGRLSRISGELGRLSGKLKVTLLPSLRSESGAGVFGLSVLTCSVVKPRRLRKLDLSGMPFGSRGWLGSVLTCKVAKPRRLRKLDLSGMPFESRG
ncbi:hypothetical protein IE81DRAFT_254937 [Ceraceosorus guamensis]|uniref:RNI-like protein n=1 Tax=Ceraceosorus guamensis TaxID=1522189 RepID=A0A316W6Q5_9BASI|nr:hypothetical protein IE81DRAFT_254937 [Ceraceosorus guamensis]PWN44798.1 hypothetical protein IE81DRAFT_254937 [Ceraceosorus guamensis]